MKPPPGSLALALAAAFAPSSGAVYLNPDGQGDALIYPYYTVQSVDGNAFNTYISVSNATSAVKVAKVRFREGRNGRETLSFDLYLSPNDVWTAGLVPASAAADAPAHLVTVDVSCTNPPLPTSGVDFNNFLFAGAAADGAGTGLDRTREGFLELIEMADLSPTRGLGLSAVHARGGAPSCSGLTGPDIDGPITNTDGYTAPTGGMSGTLTLINVNSGRDFTLNADALANLATRPMYRSLTDPVPVDFNAAAIDPVSHVIANGAYYRSLWSRPADAVSAVLMRSSWWGELVLDAGTRSQTDVVITLPTKPYHVSQLSTFPPFTRTFLWGDACTAMNSAPAGEPVTVSVYNREELQFLPPTAEFPEPPPHPPSTLCPTTAVISVVNSSGTTTRSRALGSTNLGIGGVPIALPPGFQNGSIGIAPSSGATLMSLPGSVRTILATGEVVIGPHIYSGLPATGFWVRTFDNGTLTCNGISCQGNYGGSFPLTYKRSISP